MGLPTLAFLRNEAGEEEGLSDAGIETFRDAPYASCAREAGQNSLDARAERPVCMTFNVLTISRHEFPAHEKLLESLRACASKAEQEKEREFFNNALEVATKSTIPVLEIADFNTIGLKGPPNEPGTPFYSLLKASGVSKKESETSGGSFGIGKNASFAVSDLRFVFYSTLYNDPTAGASVAAQGKIRLMSHVDGNSIARRATGYWGNATNFSALTALSDIPKWMRRTKQGTSIFCSGFSAQDDWAAHIASSLVAHFFCAVHYEDMVFEISNNTIHINKSTIEGFLSNETIRSAAERSGHLEDLDFARHLYHCLVSPNTTSQTISVPDLGDLRVRILVEPGLPRRVAFIRNGMFITDNLKDFGQPLQRFPGAKDFVALVEPANEEAAKLLKRMENPAHANLSGERISDPVKRKKSVAAMRKLGVTLREMIKDITGAEQQDAVILDELGRFFGELVKPDQPPNAGSENDPEIYTYTAPRLKRTRPVAPKQTGGEAGGRPGTGSGSGDSGGGIGPSPGTGFGGPGPKGTQESVHLADLRNVVRRDPDGAPRSRVLHFSPSVTGQITLTLHANGVNTPAMLTVQGSDHGTIDGGSVILAVAAGERYNVTLTFAEPYDGPLEVSGSINGGAEPTL